MANIPIINDLELTEILLKDAKIMVEVIASNAQIRLSGFSDTNEIFERGMFESDEDWGGRTDIIFANVYAADYFPNYAYVYPIGGETIVDENSPIEPEKRYLPTFEFRKAWSVSEPNVKGNIVEAVLEYDPSNMTYDPEKKIHGSDEFGDRRKFLAEDLNVEGTSPTNAYGHKHRRPYWDIFLREMFEGGKLDEYAEGTALNLDGLIKL